MVFARATSLSASLPTSKVGSSNPSAWLWTAEIELASGLQAFNYSRESDSDDSIIVACGESTPGAGFSVTLSLKTDTNIQELQCGFDATISHRSLV